MNTLSFKVKQLGLTYYENVFAAMKTFTAERTPDTLDELWLTQHYPVFTQGQAGKPEHLLKNTLIPLVQSDRGGQVTYHGPGQIVLYLLIDIKRRGIGVRQMVSLIENAVIATLSDADIVAFSKPEAPGVYVSHHGCDEKIASLGLRVKNGRTYHGVSLNVDMDLTPFGWINPCGYAGLKMTQIRALNLQYSFELTEKILIQTIKNALAETTVKQPLPNIEIQKHTNSENKL